MSSSLLLVMGTGDQAVVICRQLSVYLSTLTPGVRSQYTVGVCDPKDTLNPYYSKEFFDYDFTFVDRLGSVLVCLNKVRSYTDVLVLRGVWNQTAWQQARDLVDAAGFTIGGIFNGRVLDPRLQQVFNIADPLASSSVVSEDCHLGSFSELGIGCIVGARCVIAEHVKLGAGVVVEPGVILMPRVLVGDGVTLEAGVIAKRGVRIGERSTVRVGTVVTEDIPPDTVYPPHAQESSDGQPTSTAVRSE